MSRPKASLVAMALACAFAACTLVSLESLGIATEPAADGEVVPVGEPLRVTFSVEPQRASAESAFRLSSASGSSAGDFVWSGNSFAFYPVPPLKKGCRWTLSLTGGITATDGREYDASRTV